MLWKQSAGWVIGLIFLVGSESGLSGQHPRRHVAAVVWLLVRKTVVKFGGKKVEGSTSASAEIAGMTSVGTAIVLTNREVAKQMVKARNSIEDPKGNAASKVGIEVCRG